VATSFSAESAAGAASRRGDDEAADDLRGVAGAVRGNIRVLRSLLMDIYPPGLRAAGLDHALHDLAATARNRGVTVEVAVETAPDAIGETDEQLVYRVAQETLRNAVTHAAPCTVRIQVRADGEDLVLDVADDGPGFDAAILGETPSDGHLGTRVLVDLATHAGAELAVATAPGDGTRWRLRIPSFGRRKLADTRRESA
jgi:two-component system, NarL family, sensor kinase